jgi:polysaccharide biosynthesis protein PslH
MKRLLFISVTVPLPLTNGQRMRIWSLLRVLAENNEVHLLTFGSLSEISRYRNELAKVCVTVEGIPHDVAHVSDVKDPIRRLFALFSSMPYAARRFLSPEMAQRILVKLNEHFDAVFTCSIFSAINLPKTIKMPLVVDQDSIDHVVLRRYLLHERNRILRMYGQSELQRLEQWERAMRSRASLVLTCSQNDQAIIKEINPTTPVAVVPNAIDLCDYVSAPNEDANTVAYAGCMDWLPNRDAVEYFLLHIWPIVQRLKPDARFRIIFSPTHAPSKRFLRELSGICGVDFLESDNVRAELGKAAVFVVPLRIGSGTRFKILEAGAMAKAIVSTKIGAEGQDFKDGEEIVLEDDPAEFARRIMELLEDSQRRTRLGINARMRVQREYSFDILRTTLNRALANLDLGLHSHKVHRGTNFEHKSKDVFSETPVF